MYVIINENKYEIPEITFDTVCELEEYDVKLIGISKSDVKVATMVRGIAAWLMQTDVRTASKEIEAHVAKGNSPFEIVEKVLDTINAAGFLSQKGPKQPQDHMGKQGNKVSPYPRNNQYPQNRSQRRNHNRNNGNRSQK